MSSNHITVTSFRCHEKSTIYSTVYPAKQYQSSTWLSLWESIHWWPMDSPHKGPVMMLLCRFHDDVVCNIIMTMNTFVIAWNTIQFWSKVSSVRKYVRVQCPMFPHVKNLNMCYSCTTQGLYSLSRKTSYRKISWSLEVARFGNRPRGIDFFNCSAIWQAARQQRCRDACQISVRNDHYNTQSRGFETSRDLAVRRLIA